MRKLKKKMAENFTIPSRDKNHCMILIVSQA